MNLSTQLLQAGALATIPLYAGVGGRWIAIRLPIWESNPELDGWLLALDKKSLVRGFTYGMISDYTG
jgi:hypothetical protein